MAPPRITRSSRNLPADAPTGGHNVEDNRDPPPHLSSPSTDRNRSPDVEPPAEAPAQITDDQPNQPADAPLDAPIRLQGRRPAIDLLVQQVEMLTEQNRRMQGALIATMEQLWNLANADGHDDDADRNMM